MSEPNPPPADYAVTPATVRPAVDPQRLRNRLAVAKVQENAALNARHQVRAAMDEALERYPDLVDFAPIGYFTLDPTGLILQLNLAGAELLGKPRAALVGRRLHEFLAAGSRQVLADSLALVFSGQECPGDEVVVPGADRAGQLAYVGARLGATGATCRVALLDVTPDRASERQHLPGLETAPVLLWMAGPEGHCFYFNPSWLQFTGRSLDQEFGNGWAAGVHPADQADCLATYTQAVAERQPFTMAYRLRRADGAYRWVEDSGVPRYDQQGQLLGFIGYGVDVTERKQTEQALERLEWAMQATQDALWDWNMQTNDAYVNAAYFTMLGYPAPAAGDSAYHRWLDWLHPEDRERLLTRDIEVFKATGCCALELRLRAQDGRYRWILSRGKVVERDAAGGAVRAIGTHVDITERKHAELALLGQGIPLRPGFRDPPSLE